MNMQVTRRSLGEQPTGSIFLGDTMGELLLFCYIADMAFVGGSLISNEMLRPVVTALKSCPIPVILFPGHHTHVVPNADAILLLSLISGRNPEYLIGQHVQAARSLKNSTLEILPTSYMLVGSSTDSSVAYVSNTQPIPFEKTEIALSTAIAGEMLGHQLLFLDAGSGARQSVTGEMIRSIRQETDNPLIIGGGIRTSGQALAKYQAGADIVVVGNVLEEDSDLLEEFCQVRNECNTHLNIHE